MVAGLNPGLPGALTSSKLWLASGQSLLIALAAGSLATLLGSALLLTSRHLRVRDRKRRAAALWEASGSVILMIPAVVLSTGLFILFMPFADVFALGPWLVVLVNALMALPYVLRTLSAPMQLVVRQYDRLADSLGYADCIACGWWSGPCCAARWPRRTLSMILSLGTSAPSPCSAARSSPPCPGCSISSSAATG